MVHPIYVLRGQEVITEGSPGNEFYMLMAGELEVLKVGAVLFIPEVPPYRTVRNLR